MSHFFLSSHLIRKMLPFKQISVHFIKKETLAQVFSCEFSEISKNTFFTEHLRANASARSRKVTLKIATPKEVNTPIGRKKL